MDNKDGLVEDDAPHSGIRSDVINPTNRHRDSLHVNRAAPLTPLLIWQCKEAPYDATTIASANATENEVEQIVTHNPHSASINDYIICSTYLIINWYAKHVALSVQKLIKNKQLYPNVPRDVEKNADKQIEFNSESLVSAKTSSYVNARQHGFRVKPNASKDRSTSLTSAPAEADLLGSGVWKITDSLYIGTELFSMNYHSICRLDIKHTIELQAANEETNPPYQRCFCEKNHSTSRLILKPIPNEQGFSGQRKKNDETMIFEKLGSFCKAVNKAVSKGEKVLVVSKKAVNRGPAFCSAYLMVLKEITKQAAIFEMFPHTIKIEPYLEHTLRLWNAKLGYLEEPGSHSTSTKELSRSSSHSSLDLRGEGTTSKTRRLKRSLSRTASRIFRSPSITIKK
ncbi:hypothetical protein PRIPAC_95172 [Pristionchus pacificus]|uniref:Uncharacterized protein n=1 Tax=Pristionchus pacificus TaxID=54126 RepID=A0A2A6BDB7_PRIPA|nr:hypothetical protein PRIPAC_95172 [Pristionchus pacificus]|eukprot:PDM63831.1 hypothetical protein PRIPAC_49804 [Pristionchus pacificus]